MQNEITLADIIKVLIKYKNLILSLVLISVLAAAVLSFFTPKEYKATATILPAQGSMGSDLLGALSGITFGSEGFGGGGNGQLIAVLKSQVLAKTVIEDLGLLKVIYKKYWDENTQNWKKDFVPSVDKGARYLSSNLEVKSGKNTGSLEIIFSNEDPQIAAAIVNSYVKKLSEFLIQNSIKISFRPLDPAIPPDAPYKPKIKQNILLAGLASVFIGIMLAFFLNYLKNTNLQ